MTCPEVAAGATRRCTKAGGARALASALVAVSFLAYDQCVCTAQIYMDTFRPGPGAPMGFRPGSGVDAAGMNLEGSFFGGGDLSGANFNKANLRRAKFAQTRSVRGQASLDAPASFVGADLRGAEWDGFDYRWLQACDFRDARIEHMTQGNDHGTSAHFLTPEQIQTTKSFKIRNLTGFHVIGGSFTDAERPPSLNQWTQIGHSGFIRRVGIDFRGFDLRNAVFRSADFRGSQFDGAYIQGATFSAVRISYEQIAATRSWQGRTLDSGTREQPLALHMAYLDCSGWKFAGRRLRESTFKSVDLTGCDFREADLRDVTFAACPCHRADFSNADLRGATIPPGRGGKTVNVSDADIRGARIGNLTSEQLASTKSYGIGDLSRATFSMDLTEMDLSNQVLAECVFNACNVAGADFTDAVISGAEFRVFKPEHVPTLDQIKSTWNYKHGRMEGIRLPEELADALASPEVKALLIPPLLR